MAKGLGFTHIDAAQLYGSEELVSKGCEPGTYISTKILKAHTADQLRRRIERSLKLFEKNGHKINQILLHKPMSHECWQELCKFLEAGRVVDHIGVSNYDEKMLEALFSYCEQNNLPKPTVHQMEVHPFVPCQNLIALSQQMGMRVEGHTILAQGKYFSFEPLVKMSQKYQTTSACILLGWALSKGIDVCVSSQNELHLRELIQTKENLHIQKCDIEQMDCWFEYFPHRFYPLRSPTFVLPLIDEKSSYIEQIIAQLSADMNSEYPSIMCEKLPLAGYHYRTFGREIGKRLFPELSDQGSLGSYKILIKKLRSKRIENVVLNKMQKKGLRACAVIRLEGDYSESILQPKPMPVEITEPKEFQPFFQFLTSATTPPSSDSVFVRGAFFPDGRMDLCKQVVGPTSITTLCEVVQHSQIVRHFLLGNNVALQDNQEEGAQALANVMQSNKPIETWYLAGNCINPKGIQIISEALSHNTQAKALWLKRNPVGPLGATALNSLLRINTTLVLLDLHNCALGNRGIQNLLAFPDEIRHLKHLYADANAIEEEGASAIANWCKVGRPVTLYLSINRLGNEGTIAVCKALHGSNTLKRLCLGSCHVGNAAIPYIVDMALSCPKIRCLNLGFYKSAKDLGEWRTNFYDDDSLEHFARLFRSTSLELISLFGETSAQKVKELVESTQTKILVEYSGCDAKQASVRFMRQPKRVVHIDSIYRGKM